MAPELIKRDKYNAFKSDVWAMGITLYTLLYGVKPFSAKTRE